MTKKGINEMSFLDHLEELRWHLIRSVVAVLIAATAAFLMKSFIFDTLIFGPSKTNFLTYELLCKASQLFGFDSFCGTDFNFEVQSYSFLVFICNLCEIFIFYEITYRFLCAFFMVL